MDPCVCTPRKIRGLVVSWTFVGRQMQSRVRRVRDITWRPVCIFISAADVQNIRTPSGWHGIRTSYLCVDLPGKD